MVLWLAAAGTAAAAPELIFIGTVRNNTWDSGAPPGKGIYSTTLDPADGSLSQPVLAIATPDPAFLVLGPGHRNMYSANGHDGSVSAFSVDGRGHVSFLNRRPTGGTLVPYLTMEPTGRMVVVPDYGGGFVCTFPIAADGALEPRSSIVRDSGPLGPDAARQTQPYPLSVTLSPDDHFALVCDLGLDRVLTYRLDHERRALIGASPAFIDAPSGHGSGPRRGVFSPDGRYFYVADEMGNSVCGFAYDAASGTLSTRQVISTLPPDFHGSTRVADIAIHPSGIFAYVSNRGSDTLALFDRSNETGALTFVEAVPSGGAVPRHFAVSPDGHWLVCANQRSGTIVSFRIDPASGRLTPAGHPVSVLNAASVVFFN